VHEYAARNRAIFSTPEALAAATPDDLWAFITSPTMAAPGNLGTFYKGWNENGPEATAASVRSTIEYLMRGPGDEEDRLTDMVGNTYGVGVVLLTKVLCVMQPQRFIALLPYESANGKGKQDIGRVVFGLPMPNSDSTGLSIGRLAYWSNDLLREALEALPGTSFVDLEHAKEFLWHAFCHLQEWPSIFDNLPTDPAAKAISDSARDLTARQGHSVDPQAVEKIGMDMVTAYFSPPWKVDLVDREKCGWDITATLTDARLCIEVKTTSGPAPTVYVTANETGQVRDEPGLGHGGGDQCSCRGAAAALAHRHRGRRSRQAGRLPCPAGRRGWYGSPTRICRGAGLMSPPAKCRMSPCRSRRPRTRPTVVAPSSALAASELCRRRSPSTP
jgi:hypothetical protein